MNLELINKHTESEVGALPDTTSIPVKVSDLTNDSGFTKVEASTTNGNIKINGIEKTVYVLPSTIDATTVSGHTVETDVPSNAVFTDTMVEVSNATTETTTGKALDVTQANPNVSGGLAQQINDLNGKFEETTLTPMNGWANQEYTLAKLTRVGSMVFLQANLVRRDSNRIHTNI